MGIPSKKAETAKDQAARLLDSLPCRRSKDGELTVTARFKPFARLLQLFKFDGAALDILEKEILHVKAEIKG